MRFRNWLSLTVLGGGIGYLGFTEVSQYRDYLDAQRERRLALAAGIRLDVADLKRIPPISEAQNAAISFRRVYALIGREYEHRAERELEGALEQIESMFRAESSAEEPLMPSLEARVPKEAQRQVQASLASLEQPLRLVVAGTRLPYCDFNFDYGNGWAAENEPYSVRRVALCLCLRARMRALQGDTGGAKEDLLACARLGPLLAQGNGYGWHAAIDCGEYALQTLRGVLNDLPDDVNWLTFGTQVVDACRIEPRLRDRFDFQLAANLALIETAGKSNFREVLGLKPDDGNPIRLYLAHRASANLIHTWRRMRAHWPANETDIPALRALFGQFAEEENDRVYELFAGTESIERCFPNDPERTGWESTAAAFWALDTQRRLTKIQMECLRVRHRTGSFPSVLPVPESQAQDVFQDGGTYKYLHGRRGFVIYSFGRNRVDDKGDYLRKFGYGLEQDIAVWYPWSLVRKENPRTKNMGLPPPKRVGS